MAAVLTLDRTRFGEESCWLSWSDETPEVPPDEEDTVDRSGLVSSGMKGEWALAHRRPEPAYAPAADRLSRPVPPSKRDFRSLNAPDPTTRIPHMGLQELRTDV
jgi:hypothetical protein